MVESYDSESSSITAILVFTFLLLRDVPPAPVTDLHAPQCQSTIHEKKRKKRKEGGQEEGRRARGRRKEGKGEKRKGGGE